MRRRLLLVASAAAALVLPAAPAQAEVAWTPCTEPGFEAFQCGRVGVPLDRSGGVPGGIDLAVRRLPAPSNPARTAVVFLSGGPGQAATGSARQIAEALAPAFGTRDLIAFDQRGTGASSPLQCEAIRRERTSRRAAEGCANEIGPRRAFFRTADSVADIEDLRAAAGYERLVLYGVSYGTKVAQHYAARFPERVESLVLDSVVTPEGPDPLRRSSFAASGRILNELCGAGRCRGITPSPVSDVRRLIARGAIRGRYVTSRGRIRRASLPSRLLFDLLQSGDTNPAYRALLPGALRAAALGDEAPLLRLAVSAFGGDGSQVPSSGVNQALYLTTVCEELPFPWDRAAGPDQRLEQATAALNAVPASAFAPFNRAAAAEASLVGLCFAWPNASPPPEDPGPLPRVPALVLSGATDVRTPVEDARGVAERLGATPVVVPHTGHSVLGGDFSGCARAAVAAFFRDGSAPACPADVQPLVYPTRRPPRSLRGVATARRYKGRVGRTLNAVALTREDALVAALGAELDGATRIGGVRRGTILVRSDGDVVLRGVELVPGVRVTGRFPSQGSRARLRITGRAAARGRLTLTRAGGVAGTLGGRRIRARPRAAAATGPFGGPPEARRVVPFPELRGG
jgi:pimeloyl-ACP methyl ester carboxylesterase